MMENIQSTKIPDFVPFQPQEVQKVSQPPKEKEPQPKIQVELVLHKNPRSGKNMLSLIASYPAWLLNLVFVKICYFKEESFSPVQEAISLSQEGRLQEIR